MLLFDAESNHQNKCESNRQYKINKILSWKFIIFLSFFHIIMAVMVAVVVVVVVSDFECAMLCCCYVLC